MHFKTSYLVQTLTHVRGYRPSELGVRIANAKVQEDSENSMHKSACQVVLYDRVF